MSGILGWIGSTPGLNTLEMLNALVRESQALAVPETRVLEPSAAAATWKTSDHADVCAAADVIVALAGHARWDVPALREQVEQHGWAASVIEAYRVYGEDFLDHLHGAFAVALLDTHQQVALLAIDRLGIQPLAFAETARGLVFASDARAVAAHPDVDGMLSPQGIFNYLFFHMVPSPGSIFAGVQKLLPGERVIWRQGRLDRGFYWRLAYRDAGMDESFDAKARRFKGLLADAVRSAADAPNVGAFLSGGTDSSTVAGMLTQTLGRPAETFSIGFDAEGYDETGYARIASSHFGTRPHEYYVTPSDVVVAIPKIAAAYDEPFGNASVIPSYYCARFARESGIGVMLAGDGGDEIFGGNARYAKQKVFELYGQLPHWARQALIEPLVGALPGVSLLNKAKSYVAQARIPLPERLETYNFMHREPLDHILMPAFLAQIQAGQPEALLREVYDRTESQPGPLFFCCIR